MVIDVIPFLILSAIAVAAAIGMVASRNAVHAALFLVINFSAIAVFYLLLNAPLLAMVQIAVYVGAIMVLFLLTIMLLGAEELDRKDRLEWQRPLAIVLALVLVIEGGYVFFARWGGEPGISEALADSSPQAVGAALFDSHLLPFEITAVLLLVAMVGVVVLTLSARDALHATRHPPSATRKEKSE